MRIKALLIITYLALAGPGFSQVGHPAKGSWSGFMENSTEGQVRIRLLIDDHNGDLSAIINPGRRGIVVSSVELDAANWSLVIEADIPGGELVLTGTLSNLGSWTNRKYIGTFTLGNETGPFNLTVN